MVVDDRKVGEKDRKRMVVGDRKVGEKDIKKKNRRW